MKKRFVVDHERDESGHWIAAVRGVAGCHTYGRTLEEARRNIRDALAVSLDAVDDKEAARIARTAELVDRVKLPPPLERELRSLLTLRKQFEENQRSLNRLARRLTRELTSGALRLSVRDAAALLGVSHQRVQQLKEAS